MDLPALIRRALVERGDFSIAVTAGDKDGEFRAYHGTGNPTHHEIATADDPVTALMLVLSGRGAPNPPSTDKVRQRVKQPATSEIEDLLS